MSDENKEKVFPDGADDEALTQAETNTETEIESAPGGDWSWDAAVPETNTENITFTDLAGAAMSTESEKEDENAAENVPEEENFETDEENSEESQDSDDDGLCIVCGKSRGNSPSDLYCNECREKFLRTDFGVGHIILVFVMVVAAALGYFVCSATGSVAVKLSKVESYISERRFDDAVNKCSEITEDVSTINSAVNAVFSSVNSNFGGEDWFGEGKKTTELVLEAYAEVVTIGNSEHETFVSSVESAFDEKELSKLEHAKIKKVYDFCKELITAGETYMDGLQEYITYDDNSQVKVDYDKALKYIDSLASKTTAEKCMADYCRFLTAYYAEKGKDVVLGYFDSLYKTAGEFDYIFTQVYMDAASQLEAYDVILPIAQKALARNLNDSSAYYYAIQAYLRTNDLDSALKMCEEMKKNNTEGLDYYSMKAAVLRRQGKFEEAVKLCKEGITAGEDAEIYRQEAIAYLLMEDKDAALEAINQAYDIALQNAYTGQYVSLETLNTAALITCICGDTEKYNEIKEMFDSEGVEFENSVKDCIKGEITFEEIFMEGIGDV